MACDRGGQFEVIEFWLEDKFLLELMTPAELARYSAAHRAAPDEGAGMAGKQQAERRLT